MARRTVVAPDAAAGPVFSQARRTSPRRTAVVTPSAPGGADTPPPSPAVRPSVRRTRARWNPVDVVTGVVGVLLMAVAAALVPILPVPEVVLPQYKVTFADVSEEFQSQTQELAEGATVDFTFDIPRNNVSLVAVNVVFVDDHPASDPDQFTVELIDPSGKSVTKLQMVNEPGVPTNQSEDPSGMTFRAVPFEGRILYTNHAKPADGILTAKDEDETGDQLLARMADNFTAGGAGTWTVRATLDVAGDCAARSPAAVVPAPALPACPYEPDNPRGVDATNRFTVAKLTYTSYQAAVTLVAPGA